MSLQRFSNTQILVEIQDRVIEQVTLKRKVLVQSINIELTAQRVALNLLIKYYGANEDGSYADELNVPGITAYNHSLVADMTTLVDASTGIKICDAANEYVADPNSEGQTMLNPLLTGKTYMYEFELFAAMMYQSTIVANVAIAKVQYAASQNQLD